MKTTARVLLVILAVALSLATAPAHAQAPRNPGPAPTVSQPLPPASPQAARAQCDDLLARARQALGEGDLAAAKQLVDLADSLGVDYGPLHMGDTPKRLRGEIDSATRSGRPAAAGLPLANAVAQPGAGNPFAAYPSTGVTGPANFPASQPGAQAVLPLPAAGANLAAGAAAPVSSTPERQRTDRLLVEARRALALGDVRTAGFKLQEARSLGVQYAPSDDSPEKFALLLANYNGLIEQQATRGNTEAYRQRHARILMEQAHGLLQWREYDEAERLARLASQQGITFTPYEPQPKDLLDRIAAERARGRQPAALAAQTGPAPSLAAKQRAADLARAARAALLAGDLARAELLARDAERLQIPDAFFAPGEERPAAVLEAIRTARLVNPAGAVTPAGAVMPATGGAYDPRANQALYNPADDATRNVPAQALSTGQPAAAPPSVAPGAGMSLYQQGEEALRAHDTAAALQFFRQAQARVQELDPVSAQRLQDRLQMLSAPSAAAQPGASSPNLEDFAAQRQILARQLATDVANDQAKAEELRETEPKMALGLLEETQRRIEQSEVEAEAKAQLQRRVDRSLTEIKKYIADNRGRIEVEEKSRAVEGQIEREEQLKVEVQEKLALMVEEYNQLMDERRFAEALVVAKRARELDPQNALTEQLVRNANLIWSYENNLAISADKEQALVAELLNSDAAATPLNPDTPYVMPDAREWEILTEKRLAQRERGRHRSEREMEIEQKLKTPVMLQFEQAPLSVVLDQLARLAEVNLHLDPQGLAEEGVTTDTPVTIKLSQEISLKSALNLILEPLHLSFVIKDEVLKVTGEQLRDGEVYPMVYNVADLVVPIPNFVPSPNMGLAGSYLEAMSAVNPLANGPFGGSSAPLTVVASRSGGSGSAGINPAVMAQLTGAAQSTLSSAPTGGGPGGLGGAALADFDSLIELITTTVHPTSWDEVGGPGAIQPFETNLSLVISQTQEVHEEIKDLLDQLRRLQDLQVTIEVRFITLNDNYFERIGVDFDFDIDDDIDRPFQVFGRPVDVDDINEDPDALADEPIRDVRDTDYDENIVVGLQAPNVFSADLDIPFRQGSFGFSQPAFGGYDPATAASVGFAILSDIEAFFFIEATQGNRRSNVLQAPKVTLFNGQQAIVADQSQSPFVVSVIPVVGDFAAAQQPVIVILSEGTFLTVQAVVSDDRRFVRLTVLPFFSRIGDVETFTFHGEDSTTVDTSEEGNQDNPNDNTKRHEEVTRSRIGTTVQLPTFSFVTVSTTVSVPDGGTVLLGGIKRLSEGRNEAGVPILSKLPYINRLFRNVGIGRETQSLMMMVTPRIIIQEEEEERLGILPPP